MPLGLARGNGVGKICCSCFLSQKAKQELVGGYLFFSRETGSAFLAGHLFGLSDKYKSLKMACLILFSLASFKFDFFDFMSLNLTILLKFSKLHSGLAETCQVLLSIQHATARHRHFHVQSEAQAAAFEHRFIQGHYILVQPQELRFPYLQNLFCPLWQTFPEISRTIFVVKTWT